MKLIPADFISDQDKEMQRVLNEHPDLKFQLTMLINAYREMITDCIEEMHKTYVDTADLSISFAKKENILHRLGIPILNSTQDWTEIWEQHRKEQTNE